MRKLTLSLAILAAMMPGYGYSLGLGDIELNSALNQELDAEIEVLSAQPEDAEQLIIKLGSREAFTRAGIDRPFLLQQLKFKIVSKGDKSFVKIITKKPIREPFLSFLVEIDWPQGHLLREYTLLLDPPVYTKAKAASPATPNSGERPFTDPADEATNQSATSDDMEGSRPADSSYDSSPVAHSGGAMAPAAVKTQRASSPAYAAPSKAVSDQYRVQANDTLWSLANRMRPDNSISVEQMMLSLVRKNPEAFINENINGLKRGYILRIPDRASIASIDRQQALAQVREHSALWRKYREAQSGVAPSSSMESEFDAMDPADSSTESSVDGKLSIVNADETGASGDATSGQDANAVKQLRSELSLAQEALESERLEKEDLRSRLADLEQRVQNVLQLDEAELAQLQQDIKGVEKEAAEQAEVTPEVEQESVESEAPEEMVVDDAVEGMPEVSEMSDDTSVEDDQAVAEESAEKADGDALFVDETDGTESEVDAEAEQEVTETPADQPEAPAFVQADKPKSFIEKLLDDPTMLAAIAGGLLGVFALIGLLLRRRRVNKADDEWVAGEDSTSLDDIADSIVNEDVPDFEATGEMPALADDETTRFDDTQIEAPAEDDMEKTVVGLEGAEAEADEEEKDDVLAEADVYLAYGIYQQAEELLSSAINQNPERDDYRMKLLETHFAGKNSAAFAALATEVHQRKGKDKPYWDRVVAMGRDLCPDNDLFIGGGAIAEMDDLLPEKPQTTDLELDSGDDEEGSVPSIELSSDLDITDSDETHIIDSPVDLDLGAPKGSSEFESDEAGDLLDESELEFNLGDFGEEPEKAGESVVEDSSETLLDLGEDLEDSLELDLGEVSEDSAEDEADLDIDEDFSLDFEASDLGFDEEEVDKTDTAETGLDDVAVAGIDLAADEPDENLEVMADFDTDESEDIAELDGLDADIDLPEDLELGMDLDASDMDQAAEISVADEADDFDISSLSDDVDEVSTKLDLASAYIKMGDIEGAKSFLEEVMQEGDDGQKQEAEELLKQTS